MTLRLAIKSIETYNYIEKDGLYKVSWVVSIVLWLMEFVCIPLIWTPYGIFRVFYYITHRR
jgi:hypothetical protein